MHQVGATSNGIKSHPRLDAFKKQWDAFNSDHKHDQDLHDYFYERYQDTRNEKTRIAGLINTNLTFNIGIFAVACKLGSVLLQEPTDIVMAVNSIEVIWMYFVLCIGSIVFIALSTLQLLSSMARKYSNEPYAFDVFNLYVEKNDETKGDFKKAKELVMGDLLNMYIRYADKNMRTNISKLHYLNRSRQYLIISLIFISMALILTGFLPNGLQLLG